MLWQPFLVIVLQRDVHQTIGRLSVTKPSILSFFKPATHPLLSEKIFVLLKRTVYSFCLTSNSFCLRRFPYRVLTVNRLLGAETKQNKYGISVLRNPNHIIAQKKELVLIREKQPDCWHVNWSHVKQHHTIVLRGIHKKSVWNNGNIIEHTCVCVGSIRHSVKAALHWT